MTAPSAPTRTLAEGPQPLNRLKHLRNIGVTTNVPPSHRRAPGAHNDEFESLVER
jgi:hypothetical protein